MKIGIALAACAALGAATVAHADSRFDDWLASLTQSGWRLVALSEPLQQALLLGSTEQTPDGLMVIHVRYEMMDGQWRSLVADDAINCATREIKRVKVTGYGANNMSGQPTVQPANLPEMKVTPDTFQEGEVSYACSTYKAVPVKTADKRTDEQEKMICRSEMPIGSNVPVRVCRRKGDIERVAKDDRDKVEQMQREIPLQFSH